jgi:hypothetical protein
MLKQGADTRPSGSGVSGAVYAVYLGGQCRRAFEVSVSSDDIADGLGQLCL